MRLSSEHRLVEEGLVSHGEEGEAYLAGHLLHAAGGRACRLRCGGWVDCRQPSWEREDRLDLSRATPAGSAGL